MNADAGAGAGADADEVVVSPVVAGAVFDLRGI